MNHRSNAHKAGIAGMGGAILFFIGLLIEYNYGLFPPNQGTLFVLNQVLFCVAMTGILFMLWGMRTVKAGGNSLFAIITLTIFPLSWAMLIAATLIGLVTGNSDNLLFPLGGLTSMLFGLLAGIAVLIGKKWRGWARFAPLLHGVYNLMLVLPLFLTASTEPTLLTESLFMLTWFLMGLALFENGDQALAQMPA
jgi:hypothetical protein